MSLTWQPIKYGWVALAGLTIVGTTIFVSDNDRHQVQPVDVIEILLGTYERAYAIGQKQGSFSIVGDFYDGTNAVRMTNAIGWSIPSIPGRLPAYPLRGYDNSIKKMVPYFLDPDYDYTNSPTLHYLTVTGLFAKFDIGDGTNLFTVRPAFTNRCTNYVVQYTQDASYYRHDSTEANPGIYYVDDLGRYHVAYLVWRMTLIPSNIVVCYTSPAPVEVNYAYDSAKITTNPAGYYTGISYGPYLKTNDTDVYGVTVPSNSFYFIEWMTEGPVKRVNYLGYVTSSEHLYTNAIFDDAVVATVTNPAVYEDGSEHPWHLYAECLEERYKVLAMMRTTCPFKKVSYLPFPGFIWTKKFAESGLTYGNEWNTELETGAINNWSTNSTITTVTSETFRASAQKSYYGYPSYLWKAELTGGSAQPYIPYTFPICASHVWHRSHVRYQVSSAGPENLYHVFPGPPAPVFSNTFYDHGLGYSTGQVVLVSEFGYSNALTLNLPEEPIVVSDPPAFGEEVPVIYVGAPAVLISHGMVINTLDVVTEWQFQYCTNKYW